MIGGGSTYSNKVFQACQRSKEGSVMTNEQCLPRHREHSGGAHSKQAFAVHVFRWKSPAKNGRKGFLTQMGRAWGWT